MYELIKKSILQLVEDITHLIVAMISSYVADF
jgi:hypothetical protein